MLEQRIKTPLFCPVFHNYSPTYLFFCPLSIFPHNLFISFQQTCLLILKIFFLLSSRVDSQQLLCISCRSRVPAECQLSQIPWYQNLIESETRMKSCNLQLKRSVSDPSIVVTLPKHTLFLCCGHTALPMEHIYTYVNAPIQKIQKEFLEI
jgi:hypothetical protein